MVRLQPLLDTRLATEREAALALTAAGAARAAVEEVQAGLDRAADAARGRLGGGAYDIRPTTVAEGLARERFRGRLADEARAAAEAALTHRRGALAAARAGEEAAREALAQARREREALERVQARADDERQRLAHRRAEDAAADLAASRHPRGDRGK